MAYDPHGRLLTQTDARTGETTFAYDNADRLTTQTAPDPMGGSSHLVTGYGYDALGRRTSVTLPDTTVTTTSYDTRGNVISTGGSQTYDVSYEFDPQGRRLTMTTGGQAGNATTTWTYDSARGLLTHKQFAGGKGTNYSYTPGGRLANRTWARTVGGSPLTTTYSYNVAGDLALTDYSDGTPDVTMSYTRFGGLSTVADGTGTKTITYNAQLMPDQEIFPSAFFGGRILTRRYDSLYRNAGFDLGTSGDPDADHAVAYGYDNAGRLASVQDPNATWGYSFVPNSAGLVSGVTSGGNSVAYSYEPGRNAITGIENKVGSTTVSHFTYTNNALGQRTTRSQSGTAFAAAATESFGYNAKGEVTSSAHSADSARNTAFDYDAIGNRNEAIFGGVTTSYTANALNQYTEINPGTAVTPAYDDDGNMTSDGAGKRLVWDGENRLIEVRNAGNDLIASYTYDGQSHRVKKVTTGLASQGASEEVYLYDGWNRIATYNIANSTFQISHCLTWGRDLSGSLEGAGGVGGLLARNAGSTTWAYTYDANGNVSELIDGSGIIAAHYEYDPFGNAVVATGSLAASNPWRFSTKPVDAETGYSYYGYRFYNPVTGRWVSRDPIGEEGGANLYAFCVGSPNNQIDPLGTKYQRFDTNIESIPFIKGIPKIAGATAETEAIWATGAHVVPNIAWHSVETSRKTDLSIKFVVRPEYADQLDTRKPNDPTGTLREHEYQHARYNSERYNQFVKEANPHLLYFCSASCGKAHADAINAFLDYYKNIALMEDAILDMMSYDASFARSQYTSAQIRVKNASVRIVESTAAIKKECK